MAAAWHDGSKRRYRWYFFFPSMCITVFWKWTKPGCLWTQVPREGPTVVHVDRVESTLRDMKQLSTRVLTRLRNELMGGGSGVTLALLAQVWAA